MAFTGPRTRTTSRAIHSGIEADIGRSERHDVPRSIEVVGQEVGVPLGDSRARVAEDATEREQVRLQLKEVGRERMPTAVRPTDNFASVRVATLRQFVRLREYAVPRVIRELAVAPARTT